MLRSVWRVFIVCAVVGATFSPAATGVRAAGPVARSATAPSPASQSATAPTLASQRALLDKYCVGCHNERLKTGGLVLERLDTSRVGENAELWEKVVRKLRAGMMPPSGMPRPDPTRYAALRSWLETELDRAAAAQPNPGRIPALHRLNRAEYRNAIRDVLGLDFDVVTLLPPDDLSFGFDNIADALHVSPSLLENYLAAAGKISREVVGDTAVRTGSKVYRISPELNQSDRLRELPLGTRGGALIRHNFPVDGEYGIGFTLPVDGLRRTGANATVPPLQVEVSVDGQRLELFTITGEEPAAKPAPVPVSDIPDTINKSRQRNAPDDDVVGRSLQVRQQRGSDGKWEVRAAIKAGSRAVAVTFVGREAGQPEGILQRLRSARRQSEPPLRSVTIYGPYQISRSGNSQSRQRVFICQPSSRGDEQACATRILSTLARSAYRRPVTDVDLQPLLAMYQIGRTDGTFDVGIQRAIERLLVSPSFLFRIERDAKTVRPLAPISDIELASRLSFFLWSSVPDEPLIDLAVRGKLKDPAILEQQVRRMIADSRSKEFATNFIGQWLYLRNVASQYPDPYFFPDFNQNLRESLLQETELFFRSVLVEDRSVIDLLTADYTFVNEPLARHYRIPGIYGDDFRRVTVTDANRRGLLGQGSVLFVTSYPQRTSPVLRGKWVLENILGTPPPPPPPNVPSLQTETDETGALSMRQAMSRHRANPVCAGCHSLMDPLGFGMENFDPIGRWRTRDASSSPIDASGVLPDGTKFNGVTELRQALVRQPEQFVSTLTEKLLTYALGRGLEYYDAPVVRSIVRNAGRDNYRFSAVLLGIVKSMPFQMRSPSGSPTAVSIVASNPR